MPLTPHSVVIMMKSMSKISAAILIAVLAATPLVAQTPPAAKPNAPAAGTSITTAVPIDVVVQDAGVSTLDVLDALRGANRVRLIHVKTAYPAGDQQKLSSAVTSKKADLDRLHAAINADPKLKAMFARNKVDVNSVIAVIPSKNGIALIVQ
jgi:hypothetical protein